MCDCVGKTNELLREHNAIIVTNLLGTPRASIHLCKRDGKKRGRLPILQASFCPFCGSAYPEMTAATASFAGHTDAD